MQYKVGDRVRVMIPLSEQFAAHNIKQFNAKVTTIDSVAINSRYGKSAYTLKGCKAFDGGDYIFLGDWLVPWGEEGASE